MVEEQELAVAKPLGSVYKPGERGWLRIIAGRHEGKTVSPDPRAVSTLLGLPARRPAFE